MEYHCIGNRIDLPGRSKAKSCAICAMRTISDTKIVRACQPTAMRPISKKNLGTCQPTVSICAMCIITNSLLSPCALPADLYLFICT